MHGRLDLAFEALGPLHLKNIARPVEAFVVRLDASKMLRGEGDAGSQVDGPPGEPAPAYLKNLPQLAHALIGRQRDVTEIEALLSRYRLVTLVGAAGVGKTSLSLQVGADLLARFPDGVWFVELAPLEQAELIGEAVAAVFELPVQGERPATDAIAAFLRSRRVLLILDNCEHVIAAAAKLANALLKTCPGVFLLASSREALSVAGEHAYPVPLLDVPPRSKSLTAAHAMGHSAVHLSSSAPRLGTWALLVDRRTAPVVAEICRRAGRHFCWRSSGGPRLDDAEADGLLARWMTSFRLLYHEERNGLCRGNRRARSDRMELRLALGSRERYPRILGASRQLHAGGRGAGRSGRTVEQSGRLRLRSAGLVEKRGWCCRRRGREP